MRTIRVLTHFLKIFYNKGALEPCVDILQMAGARPSFGLVWDTALNPRPRSGQDHVVVSRIKTPLWLTARYALRCKRPPE